MKYGIFSSKTFFEYCIEKKFKVMIFILPLFTIMMVSSNTNFDEVNAQNQNNTISLTGDMSNINNTRTFEVTFDSLTVNYDHDPVFGGEWVMNAYVNNHIVDLFPGSITVNDGDTVNFTGVHSVNLTIPNNNLGFIRISTIGWENDVGFTPIPVFFTLLDTRVPFYLYIQLAQQAIVPFIAGPNDPNGFVAIQYNKDVDFGVGSHTICSARNVAATDPTSWYEGNCDYRINFTIKEIKQ
ncbi:MAG TPA: hypothetical protein VFG45_07645 [Candidatus Nitrosocosmicus sp.]|nr:hypothetical protein [Candidatus Nitrosocosmicus sp.]